MKSIKVFFWSIIYYLSFLFLVLGVVGFGSSKGRAAEINFVVPSNATAPLSVKYHEIINAFNLANPGHRVKFVPRSSYNQVLDLALKRGLKGVFAAEIAELYTLQEAGAIEAIDDLMAGEGELNRYLEGFVPTFLENSRNSKGVLMALPLYRSTPIIYYNLDMLREAGLEAKRLPQSWTELTKLLVHLRDFYGRPPLALPGVWREWIFESFAQQNGGRLSDSKDQLYFDSPRTVAALEIWVDWNRQGLVLLPESWKYGIRGFVRQVFPITYYSTAGMGTARKNADFDWMADVMPGNPDPGAVVGGANLFLSSGMDKDQKRLAGLLLRHLLTPENQAKISAASGYFPVVKSAFDLPILSELYGREQAYINARRQLSFTYARTMTLKHKSIRIILQQAIDDALFGRYTAQQALSIAQEKASKILTD